MQQQERRLETVAGRAYSADYLNRKVAQGGPFVKMLFSKNNTTMKGAFALGYKHLTHESREVIGAVLSPEEVFSPSPPVLDIAKAL